MTRPFSELTKDFSPERRGEIENKKEVIRETMKINQVYPIGHKSGDWNSNVNLGGYSNGAGQWEYSNPSEPNKGYGLGIGQVGSTTLYGDSESDFDCMKDRSYNWNSISSNNSRRDY